MLIPADDEEITEVTRSKTGGIEQNELQKFIKEYYAVIDSGAEQNEVTILFALQAVFAPVRVADLAMPDWPPRTRLPGSHMPTRAQD